MSKGSSTVLYSFYHHTSRSIMENLNWTQAHGLCRILDKLGTAHWYLYTSGAADWVPLSTAIGDILKVDEGKLRYLPVVPDVLSGDQLKHQLIDAPTEKRQYPRFEKQIEVLIDMNGTFKKAKTLDVSLGGVKLDQVFPMVTKSPFFMMFINTSKGRIEFKCKPIDNGKNEFQTLAFMSCSHLPLWKEIAYQK